MAQQPPPAAIGPHPPHGPAATARGEARRRGRLQPSVQRGRILSAAMEAFAEAGYANTTMGLIAARAGISRTLLYHYFASTEEIFEAALIESLDRIEQAVTVLQDSALPPAVQLRTLFDRYYEMMAEHPELARLCVEVASLPEAPVSSAYQQRIDALRAALLGWVQGLGPQVRPEVDTEQFLFLVFAALTLWFLPTPFGRALGVGAGVGGDTSRRHRDAVCDLLLHGLVAPGPSVADHGAARPASPETRGGGASPGGGSSP